MVGTCLSSLEDYVFVARMIQRKEASNKIRRIDASPKSLSPSPSPAVAAVARLSIHTMD